MKYLFFLFLLVSGVAYGQTTYLIQADSTKLRRVGGNNELILENGTRGTTGVLVNYGNGRTRFSKPRIVGDTLFIGVDTILGVGVSAGQRFGVSGEDDRATQQRVFSGANTYNVRIDSANFIVRGIFEETPVIPSFNGVQMYFYPRKYAFRAGYANTQWNDANVGVASFGGGDNNLLSGAYSFGGGGSNIMSGAYSGGFGQFNKFTGTFTGGFGESNIFSGIASGGWGYRNITSGNYSGAFGFDNKAKGWGSAVFGTFNDSTDAEDPFNHDVLNRAFQIGIGTDDANRANAMTVLFNGNVGIGTVTPTDNLHLVGTLRYIDGNQQNGYVLTSDANGVATWQASSASTPTLQEVLTAGSVLTGDNTVDLDSHRFDFDNAQRFRILDFDATERLFIAQTGIGVSSPTRYTTKLSSGINTTSRYLLLAPDSTVLTGLTSSANATDSMMVWDAATNHVGIRAIPGGGGGNTIYTGDDDIVSDRTVGLNGKFVKFQEGGNNFLFLDPTVDDETVLLQAFNINDDGNSYAAFYGNTTPESVSIEISATFNGGAKQAMIAPFADATTSTITYTADAHTFNGNVTVNGTISDYTLSGASTLGVVQITNDNYDFKISNSLGAGVFRMLGAGNDIYFDNVAVGVTHFRNNSGTLGADEWMSIGTTGAVRMNAYGAGSATFDASGNISSVSDVRLKNVLGEYTAGLAEVMKINPISFRWNAKSGNEMLHTYNGFSAQNIEEALGPDAIGTNSEGYKSIQDRNIIAALVNAVKEQQKQIDELKAVIGSMKK